MAISRLAAGDGLPSGFPFSLAAGAHGFCFASGMPALDADGKYVEGTFEEETQTAWRNVAGILSAAGYTLDEILYVQCVVADIGNYAELNAWWRSQFPDINTAPARFTFQAGALPFGAKIEIQAVAAHGE
jgi:2-iminobutanoate/2-iminopropanoate deaminase